MYLPSNSSIIIYTFFCLFPPDACIAAIPTGMSSRVTPTASLETSPSLQTSQSGVRVLSTVVGAPSLSTLPNTASQTPATLQPTSTFADDSPTVQTTLAYESPTFGDTGMYIHIQ